MSSSTLTVLYFFQGELGESLESPNAFMIQRTGSNSHQITFSEFKQNFQAACGEIYSTDILYFRFRFDDGNNPYVWQDISSPSELLPQSAGIITVKILKTDQAPTSKRVSRLKLLKKTSGSDANMTALKANKLSINSEVDHTDNFSSRRPPSPYSDNTSSSNQTPPPTAPPQTAASKTTSTTSSSSYSSIKIKPPPAAPSSGSSKTPTIISEQPQQQVDPLPIIDMFTFDDTPSPIAPSKTTTTTASSATYGMNIGIDIDIDDDRHPATLNREELAARREAVVEEKVREALEFKLELDGKLKKEADETDLAKEKYDKQLDVWASNNKEKRNVRSLLSTMHTVLWPGNTWKPLGLGDVIEAKQVKLQYRKAMLVVHPDRCSAQSGEIRFIAKRIFEAINEAYQEFLKKESV